MSSLKSFTALLLCASWVCAETKEDVPRLVEQLKGKDTVQRRQAAESLGKIGADAREATRELAMALKDTDPYVKRMAAKSLAQVSTDGKETVHALTQALVPAATIKKNGLDGKETAAALAKHLKDEEKEVFEAVIEAL